MTKDSLIKGYKDQKKSFTKVTRKYSKPSGFYTDAKKDFFIENDKHLKKSVKQNKLYASQPKRLLCKICQLKLTDNIDFHSHGVDYTFCSECSHLNGMFEETEAFVKSLYISDDGIEYSKNYVDVNYFKRTEDIYIPKIDFLTSSISPAIYEILDIGCGSGYFVMAGKIRGLSMTGLDVSKALVDFGNQQIFEHTKTKPLMFKNEKGFYDEIIKTNANIISAIGVIEHLREPHKFFSAFNQSNAQYLYYSVPMFSLSVLLENVFKNVYPRQLSGAHTHLFTEESIQKMNQIIGVKSEAEWRFGTDILDLYRHTMTNLQKNNTSKKFTDLLSSGFGSKIDEIQSVLDKNHFCSEIHCVSSKI